jgi:4-diphosphocytidyl-2-C-methyl-D-erythritol kinase
MRVELPSPCKVNLILNILGKRPDGFHELETVMHPVPIFDTLLCEPGSDSIALSCNRPDLPAGPENLVYRAAEKLLAAANIRDGVRIHLEKRIPLAAGLGGGSGNAATTLLALNQLFRQPLPLERLTSLAAELGSDVPFFLQDKPALATGRGENVTSLPAFPALAGMWILLIHPGFGVSTPWAYKNLARFPTALNGEPGRARRLAHSLQTSLAAALPDFYNSLEAPALDKYPLLAMFQEFLRTNGAPVVLMSGSGSTTFALTNNESDAAILKDKFLHHFGNFCWVQSVPLNQNQFTN